MKATDEYANKMGTLSPKTTKTKMSKSAKSPSPYLINVASQDNNNKNVCSALAEKFKEAEKEICP